MPQGFKFKADLRGLEKFKRQLKEEGERVIAAAAQTSIVLVQERTLKGVGLNDQQMPPLSPSYAKKEGKTVRNLRKTGTMMRDIHVESVSFRAGKWKAKVSFATGWGKRLAEENQARAAWFGLSPGDKKKLSKVIQQLAKNMAHRLNR